MSALETYPLQDGFKTSLSQDWAGGTGTMYVATTPDFTFPSGITCYVVVNPRNSNRQIAKINAYDAGAGTLTVSDVTLEIGAGIANPTNTHSVGAEVIISDNFQFWEDIATSLNTKANLDAENTFTAGDQTYSAGKMSFNSTAEAQLQLQNVTTTQRDALTGVENGDAVYNTTTGQVNWREGGAWVANASGGTVADGSTTVAGKWEGSTAAERASGASTGGAGPLVVMNDGLVKTPDATPANDENYVPVLNSEGKVNDFIDTTRVDIVSVVPGETISSGDIPLRKGYQQGEETDKVYQYDDGDDEKPIGFYAGATDGYTNPLQFFRGQDDIDVYGSTIYGGLVQHTQTTISSLKIDILCTGTGTYDFGIYEMDGVNIDISSPVVENTGVAFTNAEEITEITFSEQSISASTDYGFIFEVSGGDASNKITLRQGQTTIENCWELATDSGNMNNTDQYYKGSFWGSGTLDVDYSVSIFSANDQLPYFEVYQAGVALLSVQGTDNDGAYHIYTGTISSIDFSLGPIQIYDRANGDTSNGKIKDRELIISASDNTKLFYSATGTGGLTAASDGGVWNRLMSEADITSVDATNSGVFEPTSSSLTENEWYYTDASNALSTDDADIQIGKAIDTDKILINESSKIVAGTTEIHNDATEQIGFGATAQKLKQVTIERGGTYTVDFDLKSSDASFDGEGRIYKNGAAFGTSRVRTATSYQTFSEDLAFEQGDTCELWCWNENIEQDGYVDNFIIKYGEAANDPYLIKDDYNAG